MITPKVNKQTWETLPQITVKFGLLLHDGNNVASLCYVTRESRENVVTGNSGLFKEIGIVSGVRMERKSH